MKRSEMVEAIRRILAMNGAANGMGELEEAILHTVEVKGMLPPENGKEASYIIDYRFKCLKWDPEDGE
jgi:hypothetical protein